MEIQTFSEEEKEEIIRYGLDKIKNSCMMSAVTLLMGYAFHVFLQSIVFLICFIALRKYAGGYHADTQKRCYVISVLIIAVALWATRYKSDNSVCFVSYPNTKSNTTYTYKIFVLLLFFHIFLFPTVPDVDSYYPQEQENTEL